MGQVEKGGTIELYARGFGGETGTLRNLILSERVKEAHCLCCEIATSNGSGGGLQQIVRDRRKPIAYSINWSSNDMGKSVSKVS